MLSILNNQTPHLFITITPLTLGSQTCLFNCAKCIIYLAIYIRYDTFYYLMVNEQTKVPYKYSFEPLIIINR